MKNAFIRAMERGDLKRVGELVDMNEMFPAEMLGEMTDPYFDGETDEHRWLVYDEARVDGVVYYVPAKLTEGTWKLLLIAVEKAAHGEGIGTKLMRHVEADLRERSVRILLVETSGTSQFERTRSFYETLCYECEARIRDYYAAGDDKVIFRKSFS